MSKHLIILSTSPNGEVAKRFLQAAHDVYSKATIRSFDDVPELLSQSLEDVIILPRIAPPLNAAAESLEALAQKGATVINPTDSWRNSRDKWSAHVQFKADDIPSPATLAYSVNSHPFEIYADRLGIPFIFKPVDGTHGDGIFLVHDVSEMPVENGLLQEFIDESKGEDIRLIVAGGTYIAAMKRTAQEGEFRANLHLGATAERFDPSEDMKNVAIRAAASLGLDVAGVDILVGEYGPMVIEANPSPGLGIEKVTGIDVARAILLATAV